MGCYPKTVPSVASLKDSAVVPGLQISGDLTLEVVHATVPKAPDQGFRGLGALFSEWPMEGAPCHRSLGRLWEMLGSPYC